MAYERHDWQNGISPLNETRLDNIEDGIEEALQKIATLRERVLNIQPATTDTTQIEADISALQTSLSELQTAVNGLSTTVGGLSTDVGSNSSSIQSIQSTLSSTTSSLDLLSTTVSNLSSTVSSLSSTVNTLDRTVGTLDSDMTTAKSDISTAKSNISSIQSSLSTALSDISSIQSTISTIQSSLSTVSSSVGSLQTDLASANLTISGLQTDLTAANETIDSLTEENENLKWRYEHHTHCMKDKWSVMKYVCDFLLSPKRVVEEETEEEPVEVEEQEEVEEETENEIETRLDVLFEAAESESFEPRLEYRLLSKYEEDEDYEEYRTMIRLSTLCDEFFHFHIGQYFQGYVVGLIGYKDATDTQFTGWFYPSGSVVHTTYANMSTTLTNIYNNMSSELKDVIDDITWDGQTKKLFVYDKESVEKMFKFQEKDADSNRIIYANDVYWLDDEGSTAGTHKTYNPETNTFGEDDDTAEHAVLYGFVIGKIRETEEESNNEET